MGETALQMRGLEVHYFTSLGVLKAVDGVSFDIREGETFGLVGESGCGKSTVGLSIMRLLPFPGRIIAGEILFQNEDLLSKTEDEMREIRGGYIAMCFQDPRTYLNPVMNVGSQITEGILQHNRAERKADAMSQAFEILELVGISDQQIVSSYPHQLSGGMRQRIMIAIALSCQPRLLIADEPTTEVDVITQAQILNLLRDLGNSMKMSMLLISHDFGVIAELSDTVGVMYSGDLVEYADVKGILKEPKHPYTEGLIDSLPEVAERQTRLRVIEGSVPSLIDPPRGCKFEPRCERSMSICKHQKPAMRDLGSGSYVACHLYSN